MPWLELPRRSHLLVSLACLGGSSQALAEIEAHLGYGFSFNGRFDADTQLELEAQPLRLAATYSEELSKLEQLVYGATAYYTSVAYSLSREKKHGIYTLLGGSVGYVRTVMPDVRAYAMGDYFPYGRMSVASRTSAVINGENVKYGTISSYSGWLALQLRIGGVYEFAAFRNEMKWLKVGAELGYLYQSFSKKSVSSDISDPSLETTNASSGVDYSLRFASFAMVFGVVY